MNGNNDCGIGDIGDIKKTYNVKVLEVDEIKALFVNMDAAAHEQHRAACAHQAKLRTQQATQFALTVLLPRLVNARSQGQRYLELLDLYGSNTTTTAKAAASPASPATPAAPADSGSVLVVPDLVALVPLLLDVLPESWIMHAMDPWHVELRCLPAVGDDLAVHSHVGAGPGPLVTCRVTARPPASALATATADVLTIEWPWKQTARVRVDCKTGEAHLLCDAVAAAAAVDPTVIWKDLLARVPLPEESQYAPSACFAAALAVEHAAAAQMPGMQLTMVQRLEKILRGRPFLVRDKNGAAYPALIYAVRATDSVLTLDNVELRFQFPGFVEERIVFMSSNLIVAALPHRTTGLGAFMFAFAPTATRAFNPHCENTFDIEHLASSTDGCQRNFIPKRSPVARNYTVTTFATPTVGSLKQDLMYPLVFGMADSALCKMFGTPQLYQFAATD